MERESFEDEGIANLLNKNFIPIKVDREERPDIDQVYMTVCQSMTGHGGWPLTIFLTPDKKPFFAGTYFPKNTKWGHSGLEEILKKISLKWEEEKEKIHEISEDIAERITPYMDTTSPGEVSEETLHEAYNEFIEIFDPEFGGFGRSPKFPSPHNLSFLLRYWKHTGEEKALSMVNSTLHSMYRGGIYDHIGFGFSRYSTDRKWLVPHFEKMLYDNALLSMAYLEAYQVTGNPEYARISREIFTYILRDMTSPEGAFYSAEDADSEGIEGKFYVWTPEEIYDILGPENGRIFCELYDITNKGNFEGKNIPNLIGSSIKDKAAEKNMNENELRGLIEECRIKLFNERKKRVHPHKDDKILTSWNSLMIAAFAKGASILGEPQYERAASQAIEFIWNNMRNSEGRILSRYREGEAAFKGYLDDYAFLGWGLLELYEATFKPDYLNKAIEITEQMIDLFYDKDNGGFFFYGYDAEQLFARPKEVFDGAMPSGNSVATLNLLRLSRLTGNSLFEKAGEEQINTFAGNIKENPQAYSFFLIAIQFVIYPPQEIVIAGSPYDKNVEEMLNIVRQNFTPNTLLILHPDEEDKEEVEKLIPYIKEQNPINGRATAYICKNFTCHNPVTEIETLKKEIQ